MPDPRLVCGIHIIPLRDFIHDTFDEDAQQRIYAQLSDETQEMLRNVDRQQWYPLPMVAEMNRAIFTARGDDEAGYQDVVAAGEAVAHFATNTFLRLLIKLMTPEIMARKWPTVWKKSHNFGLMETDLDSDVGRRLTMTLSEVEGYDHIGPTAVGFLTYSLKAMGMPEARVVEQNRNGSTGSKYEFEITW